MPGRPAEGGPASQAVWAFGDELLQLLAAIARLVEVRRALRRPGRLEDHIGGGVALLDAKPVVDVDLCPVAGMGAPITAVVGGHHVDAGLMVVGQRNAVQRLPRLVTEASA